MATPFQVALSRVGFTLNQLVELQVQGIRDIDDIAMLTEENIRDIGKRIYDEGNVPFPILLTQKLVVIRHWRRTKVNSGQVADLNLINNQFMMQQSEEYQLYNENKKNKRDGDTVVKPDKFTNPNKWRTFHDSLRAYLQNVNGTSGIPLAYVIRPIETPAPGTVFANDMEARIANALLRGAAYDSDNHQVHGIILSLVLEGPGYAYIAQFDQSNQVLH